MTHIDVGRRSPGAGSGATSRPYTTKGDDTLKVCLVDASLFTGPYDQALMGGLRAMGDDVRLYTCVMPQGSALGRDCDVIQSFYHLSAGPPFSHLPETLSRWCKGLDHAASMRRLVDELAAWRPDVIHFQWTPIPIVDRWFLARLRRIAPIICTVHDTSPFNGSPSSRIQNVGAHDILTKFDAIIVHTDQARIRFENPKQRIKNIRKIPHGLLPTPRGVIETPHCVEASGTPILDILLFGKVKPYKGVDVLIRALSLLSSADRAKCRARVVGKPYMDTRILKDLAASLGVSNVVQFDFRHVEDHEVPGLFNSASVVVLPYREIDASGVLSTAVAMGRPVIATNIGGFAELLSNDSDAILVSPNDAHGLSLALHRVIQDAALRDHLAAGIRKLRDATPNWVDIGHSTHRLYEQLVENR